MGSDISKGFFSNKKDVLIIFINYSRDLYKQFIK